MRCTQRTADLEADYIKNACVKESHVLINSRLERYRELS